jgi:hypothetical protein
MKHLRGIAACSVAAFALSAALTASTSSAVQPEVHEPPEFSKPFPKPVNFKSGKVIGEETGTIRNYVECTGSTARGEIIGPKNGRLSMVLTGCKGDDYYPCQTVGLEKGEIELSPLLMTLGYVNKEKKEVGIALEAIQEELLVAKIPLARFECPEAPPRPHFTWDESVIGKLTPVNQKVKPTKRFTLNFTESKGKQKPRKLEGGPTDVIIGHAITEECFENECKFLTAESEIGFSAKEQLAFAEPVEVTA